MISEPLCSQEESPIQIIKGVLGGLELDGSELAVLPLKSEVKETKIVEADDELLQERGLKVDVQTPEAIDVESEGRRWPKWQI